MGITVDGKLVFIFKSPYFALDYLAVFEGHYKYMCQANMQVASGQSYARVGHSLGI